MHRIDTPTAEKDKFGPGKNGFRAGNPQTGALPTSLNNVYWDSVQEEICGVIEGAGIELDKSKRDQLLAALNKRYLKAESAFSELAALGLVPKALQNLDLAGTAVFGQNGYIPLSPVMVAGNLKTPILQWNRVNTNSTGTVIANLPIPYPNGLLFGFAAESQPTGWSGNAATAWGFDAVNSNATQVAAYVRNIQPGSVTPSTAAGIIITLGW